MSYLPIRKVAVGFLTAAVIYVVRFVFGVDLGPTEVADALNIVVAFAASYLVKDPRVVDVMDDLETFLQDHPELFAEVEDYVDSVLDRVAARQVGLSD